MTNTSEPRDLTRVFDDSVDETLFDTLERDAPPEVHRRMDRHFEHFRARLAERPTRRLAEEIRALFGRRLVLALGAAAAGVLVLAIVLSPKSLYAQALDALKGIRTIHVVGQSLQDGAWSTKAELWFDRNAGTAVRETGQSGARIMISNSSGEWHYASGDNLVVPRERSGFEQKVLRTLLGLEELKARNLQRTGARLVDGRSCDIYSRTAPGQRIDVWLDAERKIVRGWEKFRPAAGGGDAWEKYEIATVAYDEAIPAERFDPRAIPGAVAFDRGRTPKGSFDPQRVLSQQEVLGLVFTVHDLRRLDSGWLYVVSSVRPTSATLRRLPADLALLGRFQMDSSWKRLPDGRERSYQPATLAGAGWSRGEVRWEILMPRGAWPSNPKEVELSAYVYTESDLKAAREKEGLPVWQRLRPLAVLPMPGKSVALDEVLADAFGSAAQLEPAVGETRVLLDEIGDEKAVQVVKPSRITFEEFRVKAQRRLERLAAR